MFYLKRSETAVIFFLLFKLGETDLLYWPHKSPIYVNPHPLLLWKFKELGAIKLLCRKMMKLKELQSNLK